MMKTTVAQTPEPQVSVIVPVFNVEQYLGQCLDSLTAQTLREIEIILVDDGSTDSSADICRRHAASDCRIRLISQPNAGLSAARNAGLDIASAPLVSFVDSDDWIEPDMLERLSSLISIHNADMAVCALALEFTDHTDTDDRMTCGITVFDRRQIASEVFADRRIHNYACNKLIRRSVISSPFPTGKIYEDVCIMMKWISGITRAVYDPTPLYHYRQRGSSLARTRDAATYRQFFDSIDAQARFISSCPDLEISEDRILHRLVTEGIRAAKNISRSSSPLEQRRIHIDSIRERLTMIGDKPIGLTPATLRRWRRLTAWPRLFMLLERMAGRGVRDRSLRHLYR